MEERKLIVEGMTCGNCEDKVSAALKQVNGISHVSASYQTGYVFIKGTHLPSDSKLEAALSKQGYHLGKEAFPWSFVAILSVGIVLYAFMSMVYGRLLFDPMQQDLSIGLVIMYGLVSSLHCIGMCGSLALGSSIKTKATKPYKSMISYQSGRLISYTASGFILGALGDVFTISASIKSLLLLFAGIWMVVLALQMSNTIRFSLPRLPFKFKHQPNGAFSVGLLNALMPCGSLQTMQLIALTTTNPWLGAGVMLIFGIVTSPALLFMQWIGTRLSALKGKMIKLASAVIVALMGFQLILQSPMVYQPLSKLLEPYQSQKMAPIENGLQTIHLKIINGKYHLDYNAVKVDQAVQIVFDGYEISMGCANPFYLTWDNTKINLANDPKPYVFTPNTVGRLEIHCWMNMVRTYIYVKT
jgi:sulfite exporter TauE/SafE/copper chaperone CopZ